MHKIQKYIVCYNYQDQTRVYCANARETAIIRVDGAFIKTPLNNSLILNYRCDRDIWDLMNTVKMDSQVKILIPVQSKNKHDDPLIDVILDKNGRVLFKADRVISFFPVESELGKQIASINAETIALGKKHREHIVSDNEMIRNLRQEYQSNVGKIKDSILSEKEELSTIAKNRAAQINALLQRQR